MGKIRTNEFRFRLSIFIAFIVYASAAFSLENDVESKSRLEITQLLQEWPKNFNTKNIQAVCGLFAPDLIASYPGTADKNYEEMCRHLTVSLTHPDKIFRYDAPKIEQILIAGDLAVVRLIWTLKIFSHNQSLTDLIKEKGLDVFKRQKDGSWKIAISYAYPEESF